MLGVNIKLAALVAIFLMATFVLFLPSTSLAAVLISQPISTNNFLIDGGGSSERFTFQTASQSGTALSVLFTASNVSPSDNGPYRLRVLHTTTNDVVCEVTSFLLPEDENPPVTSSELNCDSSPNDVVSGQSYDFQLFLREGGGQRYARVLASTTPVFPYLVVSDSVAVSETGNYTHFDTFTPPLGSTTVVASSDVFEFGVTGYITETDLASSSEVYMRWRQLTGMGLRGNSNLGQGGEFSFPISSAGDFDFSDTDLVSSSGVYSAYWSIRSCTISLFGSCLWWSTLISSIGDFIVDEATQTEINSVGDLLDTTGIGSGTQVFSSATSSPISDFNIITSFSNSISSKVPFVWINQIVGAFNSLEYNASTTPELVFDTSTSTFSPIFGDVDSVELLSDDTLSEYIPDSVHNTFLALQAIVFYLMGGMYLFRRLTHYFDKPK